MNTGVRLPKSAIVLTDGNKKQSMSSSDFHIGDLMEACVQLQERIPKLEIVFCWTGRYESKQPTMTYTVRVGDDPEVVSHPWCVTEIPSKLADSLRIQLGSGHTSDVDSLIERIKNCSVT
jgi:hypothetical protein